MKKIAFTLVCSLLILSLDAQFECLGDGGCYDEEITMIADCLNSDAVVGIAGEFIDATKGETVCVPFKSRNFNQILSMQSGVRWNNNILSFSSFKDGALTDIEYNAIHGSVKFVWLGDQATDGLSVDDETTLFELCFDIIGAEDTYSRISLVDLDNVAIEIVQNATNIEVAEACMNPGLVRVNGTAMLSSTFDVTLNEHPIDLNIINVSGVDSDYLIDGKNTISFSAPDFDEYIRNVSSLDIVMGLKMLVTDEPIDPRRAIAIDVDQSGGITVQDLVLMRQLILGQRLDLPHPGYFFLPIDHQFGDDFDIFDFGFYNTYEFDLSDFDGGELQFKAYQFGHINFDFHSDEETEIRSDQSATLYFENRFVQANGIEKVHFSIEASDQLAINGFQIGLDLLEGELIDVRHEYGDNILSSHRINEKQINFLYVNLESRDIIEFDLYVRFDSPGQISKMIRKNNKFDAELVNSDNTISELNLSSKSQLPSDFKIIPNPFNEYTVVQIPDEFVGGNLFLTNVLGSKIYNSRIPDIEFVLTREAIDRSGVYLVTLESGSRTLTKRLVFQE